MCNDTAFISRITSNQRQWSGMVTRVNCSLDIAASCQWSASIIVENHEKAQYQSCRFICSIVNNTGLTGNDIAFNNALIAITLMTLTLISADGESSERLQFWVLGPVFHVHHLEAHKWKSQHFWCLQGTNLTLYPPNWLFAGSKTTIWLDWFCVAEYAATIRKESKWCCATSKRWYWYSKITNPFDTSQTFSKQANQAFASSQSWPRCSGWKVAATTGTSASRQSIC